MASQRLGLLLLSLAAASVSCEDDRLCSTDTECGSGLVCASTRDSKRCIAPPDAAVGPDASEAPDVLVSLDATADAEASDRGVFRDAQAPLDAEIGPVDVGLEDAGQADTGLTADSGVAPGTCMWMSIAQCDSGMPISSFCPVGWFVNTLQRCDDSYYGSPVDPAYQMYLLSRCEDATCPISGLHVVWKAIECCL